MTTGVRIADLHKAAPASPDVCPDVAAEGLRVLEKYAATEGAETISQAAVFAAKRVCGSLLLKEVFHL